VQNVLLIFATALWGAWGLWLAYDLWCASLLTQHEDPDDGAAR
jgi:hypothetical protein